MRMASLKRKTGETSVEVSLSLDGDGTYSVSTGIGFLDHMLALLARHSLIDLEGQGARGPCTSICITPLKMSA